MIVVLGVGLFVAQASGKSACAETEILGPCDAEESQTDPAPYVIGAFGGPQFPAPDGILWEKWRRVEADIEAENGLIARCRSRSICPWPAVAAFAQIVNGAITRKGIQQLAYINRSVNEAVRYVVDDVLYGIPDNWQAPIASIETGRGDCEDYAIAKYVALRLAGVAVEDRQLIALHDTLKGRDHMVVAVRLHGKWLILDSVTTKISDASKISNYEPMFAIDDRGVRQYGEPSPPGGFRLIDLVLNDRQKKMRPAHNL
jgi:predicted transglutaminase-like cysteine proteinase